MKPGGIAFDGFLDRMERAMDVMSRRQQLVAANVTNIDTPGYRTTDVDFQAALHRAVEADGNAVAMRRTQAGHIAAAAGRQDPASARHVAGLAMRNDGNDVNIDREMMNMADTRQRYETTTSIARLRIKQLLAAIEDGRSS